MPLPNLGDRGQLQHANDFAPEFFGRLQLRFASAIARASVMTTPMFYTRDRSGSHDPVALARLRLYVKGGMPLSGAHQGMVGVPFLICGSSPRSWRSFLRLPLLQAAGRFFSVHQRVSHEAKLGFLAPSLAIKPRVPCLTSALPPFRFVFVFRCRLQLILVCVHRGFPVLFILTRECHGFGVNGNISRPHP